MSKNIKSALAFLAAVLLLAAHAGAQISDGGTNRGSCEGPIYEPREVSKKARLDKGLDSLNFNEGLSGDVRGGVKLRAVLCRTGRVTDVQLVKSELPPGPTEKVIEWLRRATFTPAERDGQTVSQHLTFEYCLNTGCDEGGEVAAGALVEAVQIEGNRRLTDEEILRHVRTRPGDPFDAARVQRDLQALLELRLFDTKATHVTTEAGPRGGAVVIFTVMELPVIRDVTFVGLGDVKESEVWRALRESGVGVEKESTYDPVKVREAVRVINKLLASRGRPGATVEATVEAVSSQSVIISFNFGEGRWF